MTLPCCCSPRACLDALLALLLCHSAAPLPAQNSSLPEVHVTPRKQPQPVSQPEPPPPAGVADLSLRTRARRFVKDVNLVLVPVTVTDTMNRLVTGLDRDNFQVLEDGQPQDIRHFSREDSPVSLCIIFDLSKSMGNKIDKARKAVEDFVAAANVQDEFCLIAFSDRPRFLVDFNQRVEDISDKLANAIPEGRTALLDAIYMGLTEMRHATNPRKALLIISDGGDNRSRYTAREIREMVMESDVQVYSIGIYEGVFLLAGPEQAPGPRLLRSISQASGGSSFTVRDVKDLAPAAAKISLELRNQYLLGYRPRNPARDGKWRKIKVRLVPPAGFPPLSIAAKAGYYAPGD